MKLLRWGFPLLIVIAFLLYAYHVSSLYSSVRSVRSFSIDTPPRVAEVKPPGYFEGPQQEYRAVQVIGTPPGRRWQNRPSARHSKGTPVPLYWRSPPPGKDGNPEHLALAVFTSIKPCTEDPRIESVQRAAITSWALLPLYPGPSVFIMGNEKCAHRIVDGAIEKVKNQLHVIEGMENKGTVKLGAAIAAVRKAAPRAHMYGMVNADIILRPSSAAAFYLVRAQFLSVFMIGRRKSARFENELLEKVIRGKDDDSMFSSVAAKDRVDAEDYFFWSDNFFTNKRLDIPDFHIGRPAFDNWWVHVSLHTFQPVVDATDLIQAYHVAHDYRHLQTGTYWGTQQKEENYEMARNNGGWQHGLIEFVPLVFSSTCLSFFNGHRTNDPSEIFSFAHKFVDNGTCLVNIRKGWRPLSEGKFGDLRFYVESYRENVRFGLRVDYDKHMHKFL